jgi:hypothetical protein
MKYTFNRIDVSTDDGPTAGRIEYSVSYGEWVFVGGKSSLKKDELISIAAKLEEFNKEHIRDINHEATGDKEQ